MTHIPYLIYIGYLIRDSRQTKLHHYNRFDTTWKWTADPEKVETIQFIITPFEKDTDTKEIALSLSISHAVTAEKINEVLESVSIIDFSIQEPNREWFQLFNSNINVYEPDILNMSI